MQSECTDLKWQYSLRPGYDLHDALIAACREIHPSTYLEIGVDGGESLRTVLNNSDVRRVVLCDIWNPDYCNHKLASHEHINKIVEGHEAEVVFLDGDSHQLLPLLTGRYDLITVDGDHSAEGQKQDMEDAWSLLRSGGLMAVDDIRHQMYPWLGVVLESFLRERRGAAAYHSEPKSNAVLIRKP